MKNSKLEEQGITLIALVVTIIILLILSGVTIGFAMNGSGLFDKAKYATETYNNKAQEETTILSSYENYIDSYTRDTGAIETKNITTTNGNYKFLKQGKIVYCTFVEYGVEVPDYSNTTSGILLDSLPYALDTSMYNFISQAEELLPNSYILSAVFNRNGGKTGDDGSTFVRLLENGKLQAFYQRYNHSDLTRSLAGSFYYITSE